MAVIEKSLALEVGELAMKYGLSEEAVREETVEPVKYIPHDAVTAARESIEFALQKRATLETGRSPHFRRFR